MPSKQCGKTVQKSFNTANHGMDKKLRKLVNTTYQDVFGNTPLLQRLEDIHKQATAARRFGDFSQLKEKLGDLLASTIQGCNELDVDPKDLVLASITKIKRRSSQYKGIGRKTQVAILGGAFDPITKGHTELAKFVLSVSGKFDEVWIMPCYSHMLGKNMTSSKHRLKMCQLATKETPSLKAFDYEIKNQLGGETYHLVKKLQKEKLNERYEFSFIIGLDNANTFNKWVNYSYLERSIAFTVVNRLGVTRDPKVTWYLNHPHSFLQAENEIPEISSSQIRIELQKFWSDGITSDILKQNLAPSVLDYIKVHKLYQAPPNKQH